MPPPPPAPPPSTASASASLAMDEPKQPPPSAPPPLPDVVPPVRLIDLVLVLAVAAAMIWGGSMLLAHTLPPGSLGPAAVAGVALTQSLMPLVAVTLVLKLWRGVRWHDLGLRPPRQRRWMSLALLLGVLTVPLAGVVNLLVNAVSAEPFRNPQIGLLAPTAQEPVAAALMILTAVGAAPLVEELLFRGLLHGWLRRYLRFLPAALISGGVFAAIHGILFLVPVLLVQGVLLAWLFERSRSLWPPILLHGAFNAVMMLALFTAVRAGAVPV